MRVANYIGGRRVGSEAPEALPITDPGTGEILGETPLSTTREVDRAVASARQAFPEWRATPAIERARILFRLKALLDEQRELLARSLTREHGKGVAESRGELQRGIENIEHACGIPSLMMGEALEDVASGIDCEVFRQPVGVFAGIAPYNFPVMIPLWFWPYAVAAGNTFVLKPSEQNPLTHGRVVELAETAGLPPGVLNVVHGGREVVNTLVGHPEVAGVSFVGSSAVAGEVYARAARAGKRVQALGGAKNHMIVLPDADLDGAAASCVSSVYGSAGQRCLAGSVVVGVGNAYDAVRDRFLDRAASLRVGYGLDERSEMGPVISSEHRDRVCGYIEHGISEGVSLPLDGRDVAVPGYPEGHWIGPTVMEGLRPGMKVAGEEIFGPVAGLTRAASLDEAIELMARSRYGNACSIYTASGRAAREFRYRAGISMIGVNIGVAAPMAFFPFGGTRDSFFGDLKVQGKDAVRFYTDQRVVISRWS